jgi:ABC-type nitrate/sulfonate/bicarbonate transport system permease component
LRTPLLPKRKTTCSLTPARPKQESSETKADRNESAQELLLDVRVAEASKLYKFYLSQEKKILGAAGVAIVLIVWELVGNVLQLINPMFMSAPSLIAKAAIDLFSSGEIYNDLYISGTELLGGYLLSAVVAIPFGIMVGWYKKMSYIFDPFINAMNATPRVALLPLVIIWLGIGILSKVGIIFLGAVFPILINSRDGVKTTPLNLLNAARSFGASEWMIFKAVVLPSTIPFILSGLRQGLGRAIVGVMVGELYAATAGIGFMITVAGATFQTDKVFVGVLVFALTGMIGTEILAKVEKRFDKWRPKVGAMD